MGSWGDEDGVLGDEDKVNVLRMRMGRGTCRSEEGEGPWGMRRGRGPWPGVKAYIHQNLKQKPLSLSAQLQPVW